MRAPPRDAGSSRARPRIAAGAAGPDEPNWIEYMQCLTERPVGPPSEDDRLLANLHTLHLHQRHRRQVARPASRSRPKESKDKAESASRWVYHPNLNCRSAAASWTTPAGSRRNCGISTADREDRRSRRSASSGIDVYDRLILLHAIREQFPQYDPLHDRARRRAAPSRAVQVGPEPPRVLQLRARARPPVPVGQPLAADDGGTGDG